MAREDADDVIARVGPRIAELRENKGLTQERVAEAMGSNNSNYQRIEYGGQNLTIETMVRVANAIGVPVWKLLQRVEGLPSAMPQRQLKAAETTVRRKRAARGRRRRS